MQPENRCLFRIECGPRTITGSEHPMSLIDTPITGAHSGTLSVPRTDCLQQQRSVPQGTLNVCLPFSYRVSLALNESCNDIYLVVSLEQDIPIHSSNIIYM
ncbi:hypothetical protein CDAR_269951 [Caerostris darwini]|uniref:Uncharacterized protein n=1 Tax=Caerostris darwini TaxID=1538125 RepID=A0AAV4RQD9_9ARAC|nr:hypothetical protein CDAR_269951 [Caerostris darwini]